MIDLKSIIYYNVFSTHIFQNYVKNVRKKVTVQKINIPALLITYFVTISSIIIEFTFFIINHNNYLLFLLQLYFTVFGLVIVKMH